MSNLRKKLLDFLSSPEYQGDDHDVGEKLAKIFKKEDPEEVISCCLNSLKSTSEGGFILKLSLQGLTSDPILASGLRLRLLRKLLSVFFEVSSSEQSGSEAITQVFNHLDQEPKLSSSQLAQLISVCIEELKNNQFNLKAKWLPILSKLLSLCHDQEAMIELSDEREVTGAEFRLTQIRSIFYTKWESENAAAILEMIKDVSSLSSDELDVILEKVGAELKKLDPDQVPPVVYQALMLTNEQGPQGKLLAYLTNFYNKLSINDEEMDSEDLIGASKISFRSLKRSESIVMVHILSKARIGHPVVREVLKLLKSGLAAPELIFNPFMLMLCLCLTNLKQHRVAIVEGLKGVISKAIQSNIKKRDILWYNEIVGNGIPEPFDLLASIINNTCSYGSWELIGDGIVDLAFMLLDMNAGLATIKVDARIKSMWRLGERLLKEIVRAKLSVAEVIIKQLGDRIMFSKAATKYTDALKIVVNESKGELMYKTRVLNEILEHVGHLNYSGGKRVLLSLVPVIKISAPFRDATILVIRKALFSPKIDTRRIAINGVLALLKIFKVNNSAVLGSSQAFLSQSMSGLSQVGAEVHSSGSKSSYEGLCLELLGVLKRGFTQQVGVRMSLYQGLYDVVVRNPELCPKILQMLYQHAVRHNLTNADAICPVDISEIVVEQDGEAVVVDPIGWFLHCVQLLVGKGHQIYSEDEQDSDSELDALPKLSVLLEDLAKKFSNMDLNDMNFEKNADYNRASSLQGQLNALRVDCIKNCYEALIEFVLTHGADKDDSQARLVLALFTRFKDVNDLLKGATQAGGKGVGKKKKVADDTIAKAKAISPAFSIPEHAYSLRAISITLNMILLNRRPANQAAISVLRDSDGFVSYIFKVLKDKCVHLDKSLTLNGHSGMEGSDVILGHLRSIVQILVKYAIIMDSPDEVDDRLILNCVESLVQIFPMITGHFSASKRDFFKLIIDDADNSETALAKLIDKTMERLNVIHDALDETDDDKEDFGKTVGAFFKLLDVLTFEIENSDVVKKVHDWIKRYCEKNTAAIADVFKPSLDLLLKLTSRIKAFDLIHKDIALKLRAENGSLNETAQDEESDSLFGFVTKTTSEAVLSILLPHLDQMMDACDLATQRNKQLSCDPNVPYKLKTNLKDHEASVSNCLARVINAAAQMTQTKFKSFDGVIKILVRLYSTLDLLAKHFIIRCKTFKEAVSTSKFDYVVSLVGKNLTPKVYEVITSVNESNTASAKKGQKRKSKDQDAAAAKAKVVKDTKNIPNLIFKIEAFEKDLIKLNIKCNKNLMDKIKLSTARDFRFKLDLIPVDNDQENTVNEEEAEEEEMSNAGHIAESTRIHSSQDHSVLSSQNTMLNSSQEEEVERPAKKLKVKMNFSRPSVAR